MVEGQTRRAIIRFKMLNIQGFNILEHRSRITNYFKEIFVLLFRWNHIIFIRPNQQLSAIDHSTNSLFSTGCCATTAMVPLLKILDDEYKINSSLISIIHCLTMSCNIQDSHCAGAYFRNGRASIGQLVVDEAPLLEVNVNAVKRVSFYLIFEITVGNSRYCLNWRIIWKWSATEYRHRMSAW